MTMSIRLFLSCDFPILMDQAHVYVTFCIDCRELYISIHG